MAYACDYCSKKSDYGHLVSHAKNRVKTKRRPNLHNARVVEKDETVKRRLCTKCLRKAKRPHEGAAEAHAKQQAAGKAV